MTSAQGPQAHTLEQVALLCLSLLALLLIGHAVWVELFELSRSPLSASFFAALLGTGMVAGVFVALARLLDTDRVTAGLGLALVFGAFIATRVAWTMLFDSYQASDFQDYYQCGLEFLQDRQIRCTDPVYWTRGVFVTAPSLALFGQALRSIEIGNVILSCITAWLVYGLARVSTDWRAGVFAVGALAVFPDALYPLTLSSHDIHGLLWLTVFLLIMHQLTRGLADPPRQRHPSLSVWLLAVGAGAAIFLTDVSRSYGPLCIAAAGVLSIIYCYRDSRQLAGPSWARLSQIVVVLCLIPVLTSMALDSGYRRLNAETLAGESVNNLFAMLTATDTDSDNRMSDHLLWRIYLYPQLEDQDKRGHALARLINEWGYSFGTSINHLARKNGVLSGSNGNFGFAFGEQETAAWDSTRGQVGRINNSAWQLQNDFIRLAGLLVFGVLAARLLVARILPFSNSEIVIWTFSGTAYLLILLLLEVQPRYSIFLAIPFAVSLARLASLYFNRAGHRPRGLLPATGTMGLALALIPLTALALWSPWFAAVKSGYGLSDLTASEKLAPAELSTQGLEAAPFAIETLADRVLIKLSTQPGQRPAAMGVLIPVTAKNDGPNTVDFFVTRRASYGDVSAPVEQACVYIGEVEHGCHRLEGLVSLLVSQTFDGYAKGDTIPLRIVLIQEPSEPDGTENPATVVAIEYLRVS